MFSPLWTPKHEIKKVRLIKFTYLSPFELFWVIWWSFGTFCFWLVDVTPYTNKIPQGRQISRLPRTDCLRISQNFLHFHASLILLLQPHWSLNVWQELWRKSLQLFVSNNLNISPQFFKCFWPCHVPMIWTQQTPTSTVIKFKLIKLVTKHQSTVTHSALTVILAQSPRGINWHGFFVPHPRIGSVKLIPGETGLGWQFLRYGWR